NEETQQDQKTDEFYQVEETATVTSREYDFEYEATVNEYEITNNSDKYDMNDFYLNYDENNYDTAYIIITNVTIHNTSDENFTMNENITMHISEEGIDAGEDVIFYYSREFKENLDIGDTITGEIVTPVQITELDDFDNF